MCDLAEQAQLSRSGLTRLVDRLERDGLLERCSCEHDARGSYACLTDAGRERLAEARGTHLAVVREHFFSRFSESELSAAGGHVGAHRALQRLLATATVTAAERRAQGRSASPSRGSSMLASARRGVSCACIAAPMAAVQRNARPRREHGGDEAVDAERLDGVARRSGRGSRRAGRSPVAQQIPPRAFQSTNERQCMRVAPASHEAHTRRPSTKRPKNTAFGPWRSKNGSPICEHLLALAVKAPGRSSSQRPPLRPIR